jgi:pectate lyase
LHRAEPRHLAVFVVILGATQIACGSGSTAPAQSSPETVGGSTGGGASAPSGGAAATGGAGAGAGAVAGAPNGGSGGSGGGPVGMAGQGPLICEGDLPPVVDTPAGWAAVPGDGVETTTGGLGGDEVTASSREELAAYAASPEPLVIRVEQSIDIGTLDVVSNKTLLGASADVTLRGGLRIRPLKSDDRTTSCSWPAADRSASY